MYFVAEDGNLYTDSLCKNKSELPQRIAKKNKSKTDMYNEDLTPYLFMPVQYKKFAIHKIIGSFIPNPVPLGKFRYDRIDHINPSEKANNSIVNLRWSNPHLNSLNRHLLSDITFDHDLHMWTAEFATHCRGYKLYHCSWATSFKEIWSLYKEKRKQAYDEWDEFYRNTYKLNHCMT